MKKRRLNKPRFIAAIISLLVIVSLIFWMAAITIMLIDIRSELLNKPVNIAYAEEITPKETKDEPPKPTVTYINMDVPTSVNTSFKTYMDWRTITNKASNQYKLLQSHAWCDENGFMRVNKDNGIPEDYYLIALGSYYGTEIGTKYRITTNTGNVFYGILGDAKADIHTNSTHQYSFNNDVVEFLVDTRYLDTNVKKAGSANVYMPLNGSIEKIERVEF